MTPGISVENPRQREQPEPGAGLATGGAGQPDVGSEAGFATAVRQALRDFQRPDMLRCSPLLATRLVAAVLRREPTMPPTQALRTLLQEHCEQLGAHARFERHKQVLILTYLAPLRGQQAVAEALHLSWSTYRRRLAEAIRMFTASLWEAEVSAIRASEIGSTTLDGCASVAKPPSRHGLWLAAVIAIAIVLVAGAEGLKLLRSRGTESPNVLTSRRFTIAVLPFSNLDHVSATRYFSDDITDDLIERLGRIPTLRVVAPTSSFSLRSKHMDARAAGRLLDVASIVEGSVQTVGALLHINVMLINTTDGYVRWTEEFSVDASHVNGVEEMIVRGIASELHARPPPPAFVRNDGGDQVNPEARDFYLVGQEYLNTREPGDILQAIAYLRKATEADESYAPAWANLAMAYAVLRSYQAGVYPDTYYSDAFAAARKAIALDPTLPRAYEVLALLDDQHWHWRRAEQNYLHALRLDPSDATTHQWYGIHLWFMGRMHSALKQMQIARRLDPLSPIINADLGRALCYAGDLHASLAQYRATVTSAPDFALTYAFMAETELALGNPAAALAAAHEADRLWTRTPQYTLAEIAASEASLGNENSARRALDAFYRRASHRYVSPALKGWLDWNLGMKAKAYAEFQHAARDHDFLMMFIFGPLGTGVRADPRFSEIRSLMHLSESPRKRVASAALPPPPPQGCPGDYMPRCV